jgi:peptidoglycan-associated lipoprotein
LINFEEKVMKNVLKVFGISCLVMGLTACNSNVPPGAAGPNGPGTENGATPYGLGQKEGLNGQNVNGGGGEAVRHVNLLQAPANQVYYFSFDQSAVSRADARAITVQANYLVTHRQAKVRLEGNTDDRGSREYNVGLGWRRAQAVAAILKQQGVSPAQIKTVSYGKEHPAVNGDNERAWSLNRRVELIYVEK